MYGEFTVRKKKIWNLIGQYTGHVKTKSVDKPDSFEHIRWYSSTKADKYPVVIFSYPCRSRWLIFTTQIIASFSIIIYSYLQRFLEIGVLKTLYTIHWKTTYRSESLFNQPVTCYFFNKRLRHARFLVEVMKLSRTPFLQEHLETAASVFTEHICDYNIIKFNVN